MSVIEQKKQLRAYYQKARKRVKDRVFKEEKINEYILQFCHLEHKRIAEKSSIAGYYPIKSEVNCLPVLKKLNNPALPFIQDKNMHFRRWNGETTAGTYNIPTATGDIVQPDIVLIPLMAFDESGTRLGYGGGYYDQALTPDMLKIGIGFAVQQADKLPKEPHDILLDYIITENGIMKAA